MRTDKKKTRRRHKLRDNFNRGLQSYAQRTFWYKNHKEVSKIILLINWRSLTNLSTKYFSFFFWEISIVTCAHSIVLRIFFLISGEAWNHQHRIEMIYVFKRHNTTKLSQERADTELKTWFDAESGKRRTKNWKKYETICNGFCDLYENFAKI